MGLAGLAKETLRIVAEGAYVAPSGQRVRIEEQVRLAVERTVLYRPEELGRLVDETAPVGEPRATAIEVTAESTSEAGARLVLREGCAHVLALNFASAKNPGGGFLGGAKAQEEDLARCSALYTCQLQQPQYYAANRACGSMLYTDHMIYSPGVPFFRDDRLALLPQPFELSVLTAPAPNAGEHLQRHGGDQATIRRVLESRARMVLAVARARAHTTLVLGAWGCGVFRNDPATMADIFARHLESPAFRGAFERVVFAIYDRTGAGATLSAFRARMGG
jgi:uncharacterized protein (TIGR02452 family)